MKKKIWKKIEKKYCFQVLDLGKQDHFQLFWPLFWKLLLKNVFAHFFSRFLLKTQCFFKLRTIITQKRLDWNSGIWIKAWTWITPAKMVVSKRKNKILHKLKNGRNANFADFALTKKLWVWTLISRQPLVTMIANFRWS